MENLSIANASPDLSFPWRLYLLLRDAEKEFPTVISWVSGSHGKVFQVHDPDEMEKWILPKYFNSSIKYSSFRRQLIAYGFQSLGKRKYTHEEFSRDDPQGCEKVVRVKSQTGKNAKKKIALETERMMLGTDVQPLTMEQFQTSRVSPDLKYQKERIASPDSLTLDQAPAAFSPRHNEHRNESEDKNDFDFEPLPLYDDGNSSNNYNNSFSRLLSPDAFGQVRQDEFQSQYNQQQQPAAVATTRLESVWANLTVNIDDLQPRSIQEMIQKPNLLYKFCPSMTPAQQATVEIMMPVSLPGFFYHFEMSTLAHVWGIVLIIGHSIECLCTNFGKDAWYYKDIIGPIQHIAVDMLWNHSMLSAFLLLGPSYFGQYSIPICFVLLPSNVLTLAMNFKVHFVAFILNASALEKKAKASDSYETPVAKLLQYKMGRHIQRILTWYFFVGVLLWLSSHLGNSTTQVLAVFVYNLSPFVADLSYWLEFKTQLRKLPKKQSTVLDNHHLDFLLRLIPHSQNRCLERKKNV